MSSRQEAPMLTLGAVVRFTGRVKEQAGGGAWVCIDLPDLWDGPPRARFARLGGGDHQVWTVTLDSIEAIWSRPSDG